MKPEWRRFAPLGLYLALLAAVAAAVLYILQREWNLPLQISLGLIIIGLAFFAILDPERVRQSLTGRQARYGSNALVLSLAFIGILVVVNYLVYNNSKRWDLTEDKQFTLAPETISTLETLTDTVKAEAFFTSRMNSDTAKSLLDQYQFQSKGKFSYEFIDPEKEPVIAQQAGVARDGTVVLVSGQNKEPVTIVSEQELTAALVRLISPQKRVVYFLTGHGEYSPDDTGDQSYSQVKKTLGSKNYTVNTLSLLTTNKVPEDAKVIVVAGPRKPVSQSEVDLLKAFLDKGGAVVVMEEPLPLTQFGEEPDPLADYLSKSWGITLGKDMIVDPTSPQGYIAFAAQYGDHVITQKMQNITSVFPTARSVTASTAITGTTEVELVKTAQQSWAETDFASLNQQVSFDAEQDMPGPVSLAAIGENLTNQGRVVVFGDADFVIDANYQAYGNADLFTNSIDWAAGQENLINLTPKNTTQRLIVPPQKLAMNLILLGSVFILPGLALLSGVWVWVQRRRRG